LGIELDMTGPTLGSPLVSWFHAPYWNETHELKINDLQGVQLNVFRDIDDSDPVIGLDRDKCVLCGLCVEACRLSGSDIIHISCRGHQSRIIFDNDVLLSESNCDHCGKCLQVCPVGALIEKAITSNTGINLDG
jgi:predicted molibdopterin-dependent oxidoreductase YjgC